MGAPHGSSPAQLLSRPLTKVELGTRSLVSVVAGAVEPETSYYDDIHDCDRDQPQPERFAPVRHLPCTKCHGGSGCKEEEQEQGLPMRAFARGVP